LFGGILLLGIVFLTGINVLGFGLDRVFRLFGSSFPGVSGYEDIVTVSIGVAALSMLPYCQLKDGNVAVDLFISRAPLWMQKLIDRITAILMILMVAFLLRMLVDGTLEVKADGDLTQVLGIPVWPFMCISIISCLLWLLASLLKLFPSKIYEQHVGRDDG
jgi:TRAP-type C4-dicarboxylate transport system permease small subunit